MFRVAEDDRAAAESSAPRDFQGGLGVYLPPAPRTTWCVCGIWAERRFKPAKSRRRCAGWSWIKPSGKLMAQHQPPPHQERRETATELRRADQFFSSLIELSE